MPRKSRKRLVGRLEDQERQQRERDYVSLERELRQTREQKRGRGSVAGKLAGHKQA